MHTVKMALEAKRCRSVANPNIHVNTYTKIIAAWFGSFDGDAQQFIGPTLAKDSRSITPSAVIRMHTLLEAFIESGLKNGVVLPQRLETGISSALADMPEKAPKGVNLDLFAHDLADHARFAFTVVRNIRLEQDKPNPSGTSKVSAFLRKARTSELVVIKSMVAKLVMSPSDKVS